MIGMTTAGDKIGTVISLAVSGLLCQSNFLGGWPSIFYVSGNSTFIFYLKLSVVKMTP